MRDTLKSLRATMPYRSLAISGGAHKVFKNPPVCDRPVIWSTGGLGDALLSMNFAESLERECGEPVYFYTRYPDAIRLFSDIDARDEREFTPIGADHWITVNTQAMFSFQKNFKGFRNRRLDQMYVDFRAFISHGDWDFINNRQPFMENACGIEAVKIGLTRESLPHAMFGMEFKPLRRRPKKTIPVLNRPFITIHDGFDEANEKIVGRSMKNWSKDSWEKLVTVLKVSYPTVKIIQLGGKTSLSIKGVHYDMVGKTSLPEALQILAGSILHIDNESGFVHAAKMMGVKSVVMFGPTNMKFFGYKENHNIPPSFCADEGGCWWLPDNSWMRKCALGYVAPLCMDSITVEQVYKKVKESLDGRL